MTCIFLGSDTAQMDRLDDSLNWQPHTALQSLLRAATRLVVAEPRMLSDRDVLALNQLPTVFVLTHPADIVHLEMHVRDRRLSLTPWDRIVVPPSLAAYVYRAPWMLRFAPPEQTDGAWFNTMATTAWAPLPVPDRFESLAKETIVKLSTELTKQPLLPFTPVVAASDSCSSLVTCCLGETQLALAEYDHLPADVIVAALPELPTMLEQHGDASLLVCPVIIDQATPLEWVHRCIGGLSNRTSHPLRICAVEPLPNQSILTGLIYEFR